MSQDPWQEDWNVAGVPEDGRPSRSPAEGGPCMVCSARRPSRWLRRGAARLVEFIKPQRINKPITGHLKKAGAEGARFMREFHLRPATTISRPATRCWWISSSPRHGGRDRHQQGPRVRGVVKRTFSGGEGSHGSMFHRAPGSIGASATRRGGPGMRMGATWGHDRVTVGETSRLSTWTPRTNVLVVKGAVPVPTGYW